MAIMIPEARVLNSGEVLEIDPPRELVLSWLEQNSDSDFRSADGAISTL